MKIEYLSSNQLIKKNIDVNQLLIYLEDYSKELIKIKSIKIKDKNISADEIIKVLKF